jgi:hypothetical protein
MAGLPFAFSLKEKFVTAAYPSKTKTANKSTSVFHFQE